jgi:ATP-dependent helicase HrpB
VTQAPPIDALPIDAVLDDLRAALRAGPNAVLEAPPGAGKTTRVPLALLGEPWASGRIVMLEPRRLAARAAALRMAETLGEAPGGTVGFRIRGAAEVSARTRIEVVTEGVLTRMLQADPSLEGVSAVIFDEIHERSLNADLGLALCLEAQGALRPDLRLLAMSATLDAAPMARLMGGAALIRAEGRIFPVETVWRDAPLGPRARLADAAAETVRAVLAEADGDVLVFLPGAAEIRRAAAALGAPAGVAVHELHGAMPFAKQRAALAPDPQGRRKVVLATNIAETSLTVAGVRIVVDAGRARRARFDPGSGMTRLVTERASRAECDQRRGRAGRTAPGVCFRLWTKGEEGGAPAFAPPEIATADLAPLALELAAWGADDPAALAFLDPPPAAAFAEARALLRDLGALDAGGRITGHGRAMAAAPLHPRLAHMTLAADDRATAAALAALLEARDPLRGCGEADMALRLEALADPKRFARERGREPDRAALAEAAEIRRRLGARGRIDPAAAGRLLALAYPDRIGLRRPGDAPRYLLSGGKGAALDPADGLAARRLIVAADTDGDPREARIRLAAPLSRAELEAVAGDRIETAEIICWDRRERAVRARRETRLGALVLAAARLADPDPAATAAAMAEGVRDLGLAALPWTPAAERLRARVLRLRALDATAPDWSEDGLLAGLEAWLAPRLFGMRRAEDLAGLDLLAALSDALDHETRQRLDRLFPEAIETPAGARRPIDYARPTPTVSARAQEFYGLDAHPTAGGRPLLIELLSPAGRPIAATSDLPGFWRGGWADARKDMRGRYPKHDWPERPWEAAPTTRAKRR